MVDLPKSFHWSECAETLRNLAADGSLVLEPRRRWFEGSGLRVRPPLVFPIDARCRSLGDYLEHLPPAPGRHCVILMQAGAVTLGRFESGEPLITKSLRRYVVRGNGRAQPLHLKTRGKSRYGSRLRLQNARQLLIDTNEKLAEWWREYGPADHVFYNCPVRLWPELFATVPPPPFERDAAMTKIPRDLPRPTVDVLLRAYRSLEFGRIEAAD